MARLREKYSGSAARTSYPQPAPASTTLRASRRMSNAGQGEDVHRAGTTQLERADLSGSSLQQARRDEENDLVLVVRLLAVAEEAAEHGQVAQDRQLGDRL